ncbi:MAG: glycosyltransferase family 2 protein, partial [Oscillospiraceae bacterium]
MKLSLIVPCYNEQDNIVPMCEAIKGAFKSGFDYEIIFVNDGSVDKTVLTIKTAQKERNENIKLVNLSRNFGKESAIFAGLSESRGDYVSIIDADLQQDPKIVSDMVKILDDDCEVDCVAAYQDTRHEGKLLTFYKNCFYKLINKMTEINFKQGASDFRTMRRTMVDAILQMQEYYRFSKGIFSWVGFNTKYIPYEAKERHSGKSKWSFWKLFKYAFEGIISFSTMPLRIATVVGVLTSFVSSAYMLIVIVQKLFFGISTSGYATIVVLILLLGGLQLFALGILG